MALPTPQTEQETPERRTSFRTKMHDFVRQQQIRFAQFSTRVNTLHVMQWAKRYNPSQWCYFTASTLLLLTAFTDGSYLPLVALIAFVGLIRELINVFHRIWSTTLGKSFTLITYASTANLALAFAALKINLITGVEPMPFIFTLGFTTLVLMPFWIALSSLVMFMLILILANIWLLISIPIRLIGIPLEIHWEDKHRAMLTMLMRIILIPIVLVHLINVMLPYIGQDVISDQNGFSLNIGDDLSDAAVNNIESNDDMINIGVTEQQRLIENVIAKFIFYFEAYPRSACIKSDNEKSVILDDYTVLLISENDSAVHGYDYIVKKCVSRANSGE